MTPDRADASRRARSAPDVMGAITAAHTEPVTARAFHDFVSSGPASARAALGARVARIGGGVATSAPGDPSGAWTRVLGLGITEPLTEQTMSELSRFYAPDGEVTVVLTVAPSAQPPTWATLRASHGLVGMPGGHKLALDLRAPATDARRTVLARTLSVDAVGPQWALHLGRLMTGIFGMGDGPAAAMVAAVLERDGWRGFGVWERGELVAGALVRIEGRWAHLIGATTRADARGRGAQRALTQARLAAAREAGCRWAIVEIDGDPEGAGTSYRNLRAAGFHPISAYPSWSWTP